jgi:hypothetical protein
LEKVNRAAKNGKEAQTEKLLDRIRETLCAKSARIVPQNNDEELLMGFFNSKASFICL